MKKQFITIVTITVALGALTGCNGKKETAGDVAEATVYGRLYPERCDDLAWENDLVGFRIYGPATQAKGERAYGYDLFFKYPGQGLVVESLYEPETNPRTWETVDSLRNIDPQLADDYIASFSYHIDHGRGMDCYPVGPTLGAGVCALLSPEGEINFPWCYSEARVITNGPDRFEAHLTFAPVAVNGMDSIVEHRIITLDKGSHLNDTRVWYDNLKDTTQYIIGVPRRDDSPAVIEPAAGFLAYGDPTDHIEGNTALLGIIPQGDITSWGEHNGHIAVIGTVAPGDTISYRWGFTWPSSDIKTMEEWTAHLAQQAAARQPR